MSSVDAACAPATSIAAAASAAAGCNTLNKRFIARHDNYKLRAMLRHRRIGAVTAAALALLLHVVANAADQIPARLADQEFWTLLTSLSEPGGSFRSDNLLSNELRHQFVIPELMQTATRGRAYIGV